MSEIAEQLGVEAVLEGSIRVAGGKVRVTVQLIDAAADDHLWAESYDRSLEDVFAVQSEVAQSVARALQAELSLTEVAQIRARPTDNIEAYTLCLRGEEVMSGWAPADLDRAVEYFEAALRLDPDYARPLAGLAMILAIGPVFTGRMPAGYHERVEQAGLEALALDDGLALAHAALATQVFYLIMHERFDEALAAWEGVEVGPREMVLVRGSSSFAYYFSGRAEQGLAVAEEGLREAPDSAMLHYHRGLALGHLDRFEEAADSLKRASTIDPELTLAVAVRALYLAQLGRTEEVRLAFERIMNWDSPEPVGSYIIGLAHQALGEVERALDYYEKAVDEGDFLVPFLRSSPRLRPLRAHPRFQALLQRMWPEHGPFPVDRSAES